MSEPSQISLKHRAVLAVGVLALSYMGYCAWTEEHSPEHQRDKAVWDATLGEFEKGVYDSRVIEECDPLLDDEKAWNECFSRLFNEAYKGKLN
jgi:hypothetical protein